MNRSGAPFFAGYCSQEACGKWSHTKVHYCRRIPAKIAALRAAGEAARAQREKREAAMSQFLNKGLSVKDAA